MLESQTPLSSLNLFIYYPGSISRFHQHSELHLDIPGHCSRVHHFSQEKSNDGKIEKSKWLLSFTAVRLSVAVQNPLQTMRALGKKTSESINFMGNTWGHTGLSVHIV